MLLLHFPRIAFALLLLAVFQLKPFAVWIRTATSRAIPRLLVAMAYFLLMLLISISSFAQTAPVNITTTAVPFLQIAPDARSAGMADMGLATDATDAFGGMHNTSKLPFATIHDAAGITYSPWLRNIVQDMYLLSAAGYHQLDDHQAVSAGIRYFDLGNVSVSDYNGNPLTTTHPREYSFEAGYSRKLSEKLAVGLTGRYIHSDLGTGSIGGTAYKAANAAAVDVSLYYDGRSKAAVGGGESAGWTGGLVVSNLGSKVSYSNDATAKDYQPANLGIGIAYTGVVAEDNRWTLSAEGNKLLVPAEPGSSDSAGLAKYHSMTLTKSWSQSFSNSAYKFSAGGEYGYMNELFLRAGYCAETQQAGNLKYFTAGVGLRYSVMGIDFSYLAPSGNGITQSPLSNTFRLEIVFRWK